VVALVTPARAFEVALSAPDAAPQPGAGRGCWPLSHRTRPGCPSSLLQLSYWDASDGSAIRIVEGSTSAEVSALAVDCEGAAIVSGGGDKLVKLWGYDEGHCYYAGEGRLSGRALAGPCASRPAPGFRRAPSVAEWWVFADALVAPHCCCGAPCCPRPSGVAHSGAITGVAVTPDKRHIVSTGAEGGICIWKYRAPRALADL